MMMICAPNLFMGCFSILYVHRVFRLYFYHGRLRLCLQYYIHLSVCVCKAGCDNGCVVCSVWMCVRVCQVCSLRSCGS